MTVCRTPEARLRWIGSYRQYLDSERRRLDFLEARAVRCARKAGMSWSQIATELGRSAPGVFAKHRETA